MANEEVLSCIFALLVKPYHNTKELVDSYFPELNNLQNELEKFIICEKYYNQIVAKDNYLNYLKNELSDYPQKRSHNFKFLSNNNSILNEAQIELPTKVDIGIQVTIDSDYNLSAQVDALKNSLSNLVTNHVEQLQAIQIKNNKIYKLEYECESLKKQIANLSIKLEELNSNENSEPQTQPDSHVEQQRFRIYLRKKQFLNPEKINKTMTNLDGDINLSDEIKSFSMLAQEKRQIFIRNTLLQQTSTDIWHPIPVTEQEADALSNENTMRKEELFAIFNSVLVLLPESQHTKYTNLKNKTKVMLLTILQEIQDLNNAEEIVDDENII
ncbi:310_t:CDS:2, partial [Dentiscutata erythropus]